MSCEFESITAFIESKKTLRDRIVAIDQLIDKMILSLTEHVSGAGTTISEYQLDDGQIKIKTSYRSVADVDQGIKSLETVKQMYINRLGGRVTILRDGKSSRC